MPLIDGQSTPGWIDKAFIDLAMKTPFDELAMLAVTDPGFARGFRIDRSNTVKLRKRLAMLVSSTRELTAAESRVLANNGLTNQLLIVLSTAVIERLIDDFATVYGAAELAAAMLLDEREAVRHLAAGIQPEKNGDKAAAVKNITSILTPFIDAFRIFLPADGEVQPEGYLPEGDIDWEGKIGALENEFTARRRKLERQISKLEEECGGMRGEMEREHDKKLKLQAEKKALAAELAETGRRLAALDDSLDERIAEGVRRKMSSSVNHWLVEADKLAETVAIDGDDIVSRAESTLAKQAEADRHFGNRIKVESRIGELSECLATVVAARCEAINPLPELEEVQAGLADEIDRLRKLIHHEEVFDDTAARLIAAVNTAADTGALVCLKNLIDGLNGERLIGVNEISAVRRAYERRLDILYNDYRPVGQESGGMPPETWRLKKRISDCPGALIIVDGHNLLLGGSVLAPDMPPEAAAGESGRKLLIKKIADTCGEGYLNRETIIFFDGPERSESRELGIKIIFSGGGDNDQRADNAIVEYLEFVKTTDSGRLIIVVTDDNELAGQARRIGGESLAVNDFAFWVAAAGRGR